MRAQTVEISFAEICKNSLMPLKGFGNTLYVFVLKLSVYEREKGRVYLVGAGPGDIGLLTVKGMKCLQRADAVVYDFHLNAQVLNYIKHDAEFIYAGKRGGHHTMTQDEINKVLVEKAKEGKVVCRLKGGDPFCIRQGRRRGRGAC